MVLGGVDIVDNSKALTRCSINHKDLEGHFELRIALPIFEQMVIYRG